MTDPSRARLKLAAVAALFFVPLAVAWLWFANVDRLTPAGGAAHGELISPARPLGEFSFPGIDGHDAVTHATLDGRWTVVHVGAPGCGDACRESLWESRQVQTRLGRDSVRVQRLFLVTGTGVDDPAFFADEHADLMVARLGGDALPPVTLEPGYTYLVDPLGNLMMRYAPDAAPQHLFDDLKRLLRVSRIG